MKILEMNVENYRSLRGVTWQPGSLNVIIGPNGSGKSNLLRVLEMLSVAAQGRLGKYIQQEGGMEAIVWDGSGKEVRLNVKTTAIPPYEDDTNDSVTYELILSRLGKASAYRVGHEVLGNFNVESGQAPFKLLERDPRNAVVYSVKQQRFEASPDSVPEEEALLSVSAGPFAANRFVAAFRNELASWKVHQDFQTTRDSPVRSAQVTRADNQLNPDGQNLIAVLHTLYTGNRDFKRELDTAMRSAFSNDFEELVFPPAADRRIQLRIRWRSLSREQSAADLSDGMLRFLFLLAALANPSPPPLIAIDEPETGLNPSMLPIVAEYAVDAAERTQVVFTTHSPDFLDAFSQSSPTTTVSEWHDGETKLRVLSGDSLNYWLERYTLGQLYRSRELEAIE